MEMLEKVETKKKQGKRVDPRSILIMDDCLAQKKSWSKDESIMIILMNGRHYQITYVLTMQTPLGIPPDLRLNFDYVFLLREISAINRVKLMANFASMLSPIDKFEAIFSQCTADNSVMLVDNRTTSPKLCDQVYWFKAKERKFTFGNKEFKEMHKKYYDPTFKTRNRQNMMKEVNPLIRKKKGQEPLDVVLAKARD